MALYFDLSEKKSMPEIGELYISYDPTSPAKIFGGSWMQLTGRFLRMANDVATGGSDSFMLGPENIPEHRHTVSCNTVAMMVPSNGGHDIGQVFTPELQSTIGNGVELFTGEYDGDNNSLVAGGDGGDGAAAIAFKPKYQDVYAWRRLT